MPAPKNNKFYTLYSHIKGDYDLPDYDTFYSDMTRSGQDGYKNRKMLFDLIKDDYDVGNSYEDFAGRIGLQATGKPAAKQAITKQAPQQQARQASKPTAAPAQITTPEGVSPEDKPFLEALVGGVKYLQEKGRAYEKRKKAAEQAEKKAKAFEGTPKWRAQKVAEIQAWRDATQAQFANQHEYDKLKGKPTIGINVQPSQLEFGIGAKLKTPLSNPNVVRGANRIVNGKVVPTYLTSTGGAYTTQWQAEAAQNRIDKYIELQQFADELPSKISRLASEGLKHADEEYEKDYKNVSNYSVSPSGGPASAYVAAVAASDNYDADKVLDYIWGNMSKADKEKYYQLALGENYYTKDDKEKGGIIYEIFNPNSRAKARAQLRKYISGELWGQSMDKTRKSFGNDGFVHFLTTMNGSTLQGMLQQAASGGNNLSTDAMYAVNAEWQKAHPLAATAAGIVGMLEDPATYIGGVAGKGAASVFTKLATTGARRKVGAEAAERLFQSRLRNRMLTGAVAGSANFATFETLHGAAEQTIEGEFDLPELFGKTAKGATLGFVTGYANQLIGNVTGRAVENAGSRASAIAKRTLGTGIGIATETAIFAAPDAIATGDIWGSLQDAATMVLGFKLQHAVTSAGKFGMERSSAPETRAEQLQRKSFWKDAYDRFVATPEVGLTLDEQAELKQYGYDDVMSFFKKSEEAKNGKAAVAPEYEVDNERVADFINDKRISSTARAKMAYVATGKKVPMATIVSYKYGKGTDGKYYVDALDKDGGVVSHRTFTNEGAAKRAAEDIKRQANINEVTINEQLHDTAVSDLHHALTIRSVAKAKGISEAALIRLINKSASGVQLTAGEKSIIRAYEAERKQTQKLFASYYSDKLRGTLGGKTIDKLISKREEELTDEERGLLKNYADLIPSDMETVIQQVGIDTKRYAVKQSWPADYERGYNAVTPQARRDIQLEMQHAQETKDPEAQKRAMLADFGLTQRIKEDEELARVAELEEVDASTHEDGKLHVATLKEQDADGHDQQVYIVDGNIVPFADGTGIDVSKSDKFLIAYDPATGERKSVSSSDLSSVTTEEVATRVANVEQNSQVRYEKALAEANGTLSFEVGSEVAVPVKDGDKQTSVKGVVQAYDPATHKVVVAMPDGKTADFTDSELQQHKWNTDYEDYKARRAEAERRAQESAAEETRSTDENPTVTDDKPSPSLDATEPAPEEFALNDKVVIKTPDGKQLRIEVISTPDADGKMQVSFIDADGNERVKDLTSEEIRALGDITEYNGKAVGKPAQAGSTPTGDSETNATNPAAASAVPEDKDPTDNAQTNNPEGVAPMPMREVTVGKGKHKQTVLKPDYYAAGAQRTHYNLYHEAHAGRLLTRKEADDIVQANLEDATKRLESLQKKQPRKTTDPDELVRETQRIEEARAAAQREVDFWNAVKAEQDKVVSAERAAEHEKNQQDKEQSAEEKKKREAEAAAAAEEERKRREKVNGVPDVASDTPADARARGFRNVNGEVVQRQEQTDGVVGRESRVKFSTKDTQTGRIKVIEADQLQPSHTNGQRNPLFFIDEAQPKDRTDDVSSMAAAKIASDINPEEITGDGSAYQFSAPSVNARGEVVQGNNRSEALKLMWSDPAYKGSQDAYKNYLIEHAAEFGLDPEAIKAMKKPVMVNELDVTDAEAIRLGQLKATNIESGGIVRIDPVSASHTLGSKVRNFANQLLGESSDENASFSELVAKNGKTALKYLYDQGVIDDTQWRSALDSNGNLTPEGRLDLQNILETSLFEGGVSDLPRMFDAMPAKAQKALLTTFMRDFDSPEGSRILPEIQKAIEVWNEVRAYTPEFASAPNYAAAKQIMYGYAHQLDAFASELPTDKFSNFAMELACRLQGETMKGAQNMLNDFFDAVQGKGGDIFTQSDGKPKSVEEAIKAVFDLDYKPIKRNNGEERSNPVADNDTSSQAGRQGEPGDTTSGEHPQGGTGTSDNRGGTNGDGEVKPVGHGILGDIYNQFKGKVKQAVEFLKSKKGGVAQAALHHNEVGDIDLAWGDEKSGLAHIIEKHPEIADNLQDLLNKMHVVSRSDNRIVLESDTHKAVVSKMKGSEPTSNWLLTAYEKKEKSVSASSSDIETEPKGKRNGTATPQSGLSTDKVTDTSATEQGKEEKTSPIPADAQPDDFLHLTVTHDGYSRKSGLQDWSMGVGDVRKSPDGWGTREGLTYYKRGLPAGGGGDNLTVWLRYEPTEAQRATIERLVDKRISMESFFEYTDYLTHIHDTDYHTYIHDPEFAKELAEAVKTNDEQGKAPKTSETEDKQGQQGAAPAEPEFEESAELKALRDKAQELGQQVDEILDKQSELSHDTEQFKDPNSEYFQLRAKRRELTAQLEQLEAEINKLHDEEEAAWNAQHAPASTAEAVQQAEQETNTETPEVPASKKQETTESKPLTAQEEKEIENGAAAKYADEMNNALNKGGIPNIGKLRGQIAQLGKRIKTIENGMATGVSSDADMRKAQTALATLRGQQRAARAFLQMFNEKMKATAASAAEMQEQSGNAIQPRRDGYTIEKQKGSKEGEEKFVVNFPDKRISDNIDERANDSEFKGLLALARKLGGSYARVEHKGFVFNTEEAAHDFAETVLGRTQDEIEDEAPLSIADIAAASGGKIVIGSPGLTSTGTIEQAKGKKKQTKDKGKSPSGFKVDEKALMAAQNIGLTVSPRDFAIGLPPTQHRINIGVAGAMVKAKSLAELRKGLEGKGYRFTEDVWKAIGATLDAYRNKTISITELVDVLDGATGVKKVEEEATASASDKPVKRDDENVAQFAERMAEWLNKQRADKGKADKDQPKTDTAKEQPKEGSAKNEKPKGDKYHTAEEQAEYEEDLRKLRERLNQLNSGPDPVVISIGIKIAAYHFKGGMRRFSDFCKVMIAECGDKIREHLRPIYNAFAGTDEAIKNGWDEEMDDRKTVRDFDVYNFDKKGSIDIMETAEHIVNEAENQRKADELQAEAKKKRNENRRKAKKDVTSQGPSLFGDLDEETNTPTDNGEQEVHVRPRTGTAEREGGHEPRQNEPLGESQQHEDERADGSRVAGRSGEHSVSDTERSSSVSGQPAGKQRIDEEKQSPKKNTRNNHAERGTDYAPRGENARIEANLKAIETMRRLVESGEPATPEDMAVLRRYSGWGGLGAAFKEKLSSGMTGYDPRLRWDWQKDNPINKRLRELLTPEQYEAANMSRNSAYYTPAEVIDSMWDIARAMGFKGGKVMEGSAGIGNIIGLMPRDMSERSDIHAVEIDDVTGQILSLLYPDAKVDVQGFEKTGVPNNSVDLAITNVPFVTGLHVFDETGDKDLSRKFRNIHDFCIAKNVRKLREGGIGIFISSSGTLDNSHKLIQWLTNEGKSDVVGAFRLNNKTFGGTGATSDIIVVRKRVNGKKSANAIDVSGNDVIRTVEYDDGSGKKNSRKNLALDVNKYFAEHPENMAGDMKFAFENGDTFRATSKALYPSASKNQSQMLADWAKQFASMDWEAAEERNTADASVTYEDLGEGVKEGSMLLDGKGNICLAQRGKAVPIETSDKKIKGHTKAECFTGYKAVKDALSDVLKYQTEHEGDEGLKPLLKKLNKAYDDFVTTYGHLNKNTAISFLRQDIDFSSIAALESVSEKGDKSGKRIVDYGKTDVFEHRVVEKESEPKPTNVKDGIIASIYLNGRIDVPYISEQLGKSESEVRKEIVESGLGFENPLSNEVEVSYEYLSGNVRDKLQQAKDNNADGRYNANIKALERIIPQDIPAHLIEFTLGSSWVEPKLFENYVQARTGVECRLHNVGGTWMMKLKNEWSAQYSEQNKAMGIISKLCDKTILGHELIAAAMQNKTITVSKTVKHYGGTSETITDKDATLACANKIDELRQDFKDWAREQMQVDTDMAQRMERVYNEKFNNYVPKRIPDEFIPEHFGGAAHVVGGKPFRLRPHQASAVILGTTQPTMLAHEVGTGKTYTLISTAMEMRRLGTARKPMIVVQNATVGQFVASAKALYPNAKILTLEDADRTKEGRKNFYAKIRYNDWDMIVVPQSVFERIPDSPEREARFVEDKIEEKMRVLEQMREADDSGRNPLIRRAEKEIEDLQNELNDIKLGSKTTEKDAKREAKTRENAAVKAREMLDRETDDTLDFDGMGIDALLVDEAHEYKHLGFATAMQRGVKGVDSSYSKKSQGVYLKTQAVLENNNGRNVVFATGTPISNTAAEIWTFMRYLMPADTMKEYGIYYFDDFVRNFGQIQQTMEFGASGKYKEVKRFLGYVNLPELVRIWNSVADTVRTADAGGVNDKIPAMEGDKAQDVFLPQTQALRSVMKYVKEQLKAYDEMSGKEKKENSHIPLTMYGIAKAAAVDARLVVDDAPDEANSKTNETVRQTLRSLNDTKSYNGTVAIFADNYQNKKSGFNLYEDIRKKLIDAGVPAEQIVVMKSGMTVKKKLDIFDRVNRGEVRVIMGSTFTLGTGVNIQERLHTLIHVDAPVRPMDYTQRNGRILRQGNMHKEWGIPVRVLRFGVEDSLDVTAYQRLKTKGAIADSIMNGKKLIDNSMENRVLEEEQDVFGDITAQLSGSQYALLKNQVEKEVRKLESRKKQWEQQQTYIYNQRPKLEGLISAADERKAKAEASLKKVEAIKDKTITVDGQKFADVEAMGDYIKDFNKKQRETQEQVRADQRFDASQTRNTTVNVGGVDFHITSEIRKEQRKDSGQLSLSFFASTQLHYSCPELGLENVPVKGQQIRAALDDIVKNVMSGDDFREQIEFAEESKARNTKELETLNAQDGKPFTEAEKLEQAKAKLDEYDEAMKKELAEKEAKYAEMDSKVEAATGVNSAAEVDEEGSDSTSDSSSHLQLQADPIRRPTAVQQNIAKALVYSFRKSGLKVHDDAEEVRKALDDYNGIVQAMTVWHGSPHLFTRFDHSHMGSGEGAQAHGYGSYVAVHRGVSKGYAMTLGGGGEYTYEGVLPEKHSPEWSPADVVDYMCSRLNEGEYSFREVKELAEDFMNFEYGFEHEDEYLSFLYDLKESDFAKKSSSRHLYEVEIPDNTGSNYIEEQKDYKPREIEAIAERAAKAGLNSDVEKLMYSALKEAAAGDYILNGAQVYRELTHSVQHELWGNSANKAASEFLHKAGFTGIHYDGRQDGECYVVFNDKDLKIKNHTQFLATKNGEVYGFVKDGEMYFDPALLNPNTAVHEYGHLWSNAVMKAAPELWKRGKDLMRELPLWEEVRNDKAYRDIRDNEDLVGSEVFSRLLGKDGDAMLNRMVEQSKDKGVFEHAEAITLAQRIRKWLKDVLMQVRSAFGHKWTKEEAKTVTLDELKQMALNDLADGLNPVREGQLAEGRPQFRFIGEKGAERLDRAEEGTARMDNLRVARDMETAKKDPKAIKLATGWERGADGKWRYEQSDGKIVDSVEDDFNEGRTSWTMEEFWNDPELYKAYPQLRGMQVHITRISARGRYSHEKKDITLNPIVIRNGNVSTVAHEIQHAIQYIEGFAHGGSPRRMSEMIAARRVAREVMEATNVINPQTGKKYTPEEAFRVISDEAINNDKTSRFNIGNRSRDEMNAIDFIDDSENVEQTIRDLAEAKDIPDIGGREAYNRLAGEVESRNVQSRLNMTDEERRQSLASETEDVAREDQIFLQDALGGESAMMSRKGGARGRDEQINSVTSQAENQNHLDNEERNTETVDRDNDVRWEADRAGVAGDAARSVESARDRSDIRVFEEGLEAPHNEHSERSERDRREATSQGLVEIAKQNGLFIPAKETTKFGEEHGKRTGESTVYVNTDNGKVYKVKDPYAKSAMKSGVQPEDVIYEHIVHNLLFPETRYKFEGISEELGDVRIVLSQDYVKSLGMPTREQIAKALAERGLKPEDKYSFGNEYVSVTDVEGDNALLGEDGKVYFIDPIIRFKRPVKEVMKALEGNGSIRIPTDLRKAVESTAETLHTTVDYVEHVSDIQDPALRRKFEAVKGRKAAYDPNTGKVIVVGERHASANDGVGSVLHEVVGHDGLRKVVGEENFNGFLDKVYTGVTPEIRAAIDKTLDKYDGDKRVATEEHIANLANDPQAFAEFKRSGVWEKVKGWFKDMLSRARLWTGRGITDRDLRYQLWRTAQLRRGERGVFAEAENIAKKFELKVGEFEDTSDVDPVQFLFRDDTDPIERSKARDYYEKKVATSAYQFTEAMQDSMLGLKKLMEAVTKGEGKKFNVADVPAFENAYMAENAMSSKNQAEAEAYKGLVMKPLVKAVAALNKEGASREEVVDYMMAKHGLERNQLMAERAFADYQAKHPQGSKTLDDFRANDYAGLTALTDQDSVEKAERIAQIMVDDFESGHDATDLWNTTNDATKATLSKLYESGLMSKESYEATRDMYENYIPLRGWDDTTSDQVYGYITSKDGAMRGSIMKKAKGRKSKADDPLATIAAMAEAAISQGNRNQMKQRFLNFVLNHPSDAVSVNKLWLKHDDVTDEWKPVFPELDKNDDAATVERKVSDFEEKMQQLAEQNPDMYKHGRDADGIPYVVKPGNIGEHQVLVQRGGKTYVLTINGNPRAAQALNGLTNPNVETEGTIGSILNAGEYVNRQMSAFYTTRNPNFVASNFIRDALYANSMVWVKESPNYAIRYHKNFAKYNPTIIGHLLWKYEHGTLDMNNETDAMFYQFMMNGGETGYTVQRDIEAHKRKLRKELAKQNSKIPVRKAFSLLGERFDDLNRSVENCARFAAFATSREMGRSVERAVYDAKEISVNFNKKGAGSKFLGATGQTGVGNVSAWTSGFGRIGYVFWNAAVQGTYNFGKNLKAHPVKGMAMLAATYLLGSLIPLLGGDGDDDDDKNYYNLPDFVRRSNICFRVGDKWVTIPLSVELRTMYGLGELSTSILTGNEKLSGGEIATKVVEQISQAMPLDLMEGGGGLSALIPSSVKPVAEVIMNKDWTGLPIYKKNAYNENMPEWTKAYSRTNSQLVNLSRVLNEATGGDDYTSGWLDINPAVVEHLLEGTFGGVSTTINQMAKTAETAAGKREFDWRNIPIASRVVKSTDERTQMRQVNNKFFHYKDEYEETQRRLRAYKNAAKNGAMEYAEKINFLNNSEEFGRYQTMRPYMKAIDKTQEYIKQLNDYQGDEYTPEQIKQYLKEMQQMQNDFKRQMLEGLIEEFKK